MDARLPEAERKGLTLMHALAIETENLSRKFGGRSAVDSINLRVPVEGVYCFLGPNGAGKTTTIRMLLGLLRPNSGSIRIFGEAVSRNTCRLKRRLGALVESPGYYPQLTGRENLEIIRRMRSETPSAVARVLEIVRLAADADRRVQTYSLGMKQRLGMAMAMVGDPELLILDEPTNGLDPAGILEIRSLLQRLAHEQGRALFVSSHLLGEVEQIADTIGIIHRGRLIFQDSAAALRAEFSSTVSLRTDQPERAADLLRGSGWTAIVARDEVRIATGREADIPAILQLLVGGGLAVFKTGLKRPSLEEAFLSKIGTDAGWRGE
jgi:ABC-type multidrug transport system ATPase subunit